MSRYTHNPEPWREVPPTPSDRRREPKNPLLLASQQTGDLSTELSFGPGPVAPHLNGAPPDEGGLYRPRPPRVDPPANVSARLGSTAVLAVRRRAIPAARLCRSRIQRRRLR